MNKKNQPVRKIVIQKRLRFTSSEDVTTIESAAASSGLSFDKFVREVSVAAARRVLQALPEQRLGDVLLGARSIKQAPPTAA